MIELLGFVLWPTSNDPETNRRNEQRAQRWFDFWEPVERSPQSSPKSNAKPSPKSNAKPSPKSNAKPSPKSNANAQSKSESKSKPSKPTKPYKLPKPTKPSNPPKLPKPLSSPPKLPVPPTRKGKGLRGSRGSSTLKSALKQIEARRKAEELERRRAREQARAEQAKREKAKQAQQEKERKRMQQMMAIYDEISYGRSGLGMSEAQKWAAVYARMPNPNGPESTNSSVPSPSVPSPSVPSPSVPSPSVPRPSVPRPSVPTPIERDDSEREYIRRHYGTSYSKPKRSSERVWSAYRQKSLKYGHWSRQPRDSYGRWC